MKEILIALNQRPVAYYPIYAKIAGGVKGGILLSQLLYWNSAVNGREFFKEDEEIRQETYLSPAELKSAKKALKNLDFIEIRRRGVPARTHYKIDLMKLADAIKNASNPCESHIGENNQTVLAKTTNTHWRKQPNCTGENNQRNSENTAENNPENTFSLYIQTHEEIQINPPKPEREVLNAADVQTLKNDVRDFWREKAGVFIEQMRTDGEKLYLIEPLQRKTGLTEQQIFKAAQQFAQDQIAKEEFNYPGYKAFKSHFYNWLPMHTKNLLKQWNGGSNSKTTKGISNDRRAFIDSIFTD